MSDKMRWRYGDTKPVVVAVDTATVIEIGDLVWLDGDDAKSASDVVYQGTEDATQELFTLSFLGVAMQKSASGDVTPIRVATSGVFEFNCTSTVYELGDLVGSDQNQTNNGLENQKVEKVGAGKTTQAVGRVAKTESSAITVVLVDITSTVMSGGASELTSSS